MILPLNLEIEVTLIYLYVPQIAAFLCSPPPNYTSVRLTYLIHCTVLMRVRHGLIMLHRIIAVI